MECPTPKKVKHKSREKAWQQVYMIESAEGRRDKFLRPYACGDHWHTGHKPGSGRGGLQGKIRRSLRGAR